MEKLKAKSLAALVKIAQRMSTIENPGMSSFVGATGLSPYLAPRGS